MGCANVLFDLILMKNDLILTFNGFGPAAGIFGGSEIALISIEYQDKRTVPVLRSVTVVYYRPRTQYDGR